MTKEALEKTQATGQVTFFQPQQAAPLDQGESSGHVLKLVAISTDCDQDSCSSPQIQWPHLPPGHPVVLRRPPAAAAGFPRRARADPRRPQRRTPPPATPPASVAKGTKRIAQKVGEEVEVALAAMAKDREELINESADLLYHPTVLLQNEGLGLKDVVQRLHERHKQVIDTEINNGP